MQMSGRVKAILQALLVSFLWSTSWVLIKFTIHEIPPLTFAGLRYSLAVVILLPGLRKYKPNFQALSRKEWFRLALLGLVFYTLTQGGQFAALKHLEAITFSLLLNFTTVLVAVFGIVVLHEKLNLGQWLGVGLFLVGVFIYFSPSLTFSGEPLGFLFAAVTVAANAAASILGRSINRQKSIPPLIVTVISMGIGAVVLLGLGLSLEEPPVLSLLNIAVIVWLALINTAFAFTLWNQSLQVLTAVQSSIINNTMLIQIAVLAWIFLGEKLDWLDVAGLALASFGILLTNLKRLPRGSSEGKSI